MKINIRNTQIFISNLGFFLLFPVFFIYQIGIAKGYLSPFLGSYFPIMSALLILPLLCVNALNLSKSLNEGVSVFFILISFLLAGVFLNFIFTIPDGFHKEMAIWSLTGILYNLITYFIAANLKFNVRLNFLLFLILGGVVLFNVGERGIFYIKREAENPEYIATYQGFARVLLAMAMICLVNIYHRKYLRNVFIFFALIVLFFNGARTEFVLFLFGAATLILFTNLYALLRVFFLGVSIFIIVSVIAVNIEIPSQSRMYGLIEIASDESVMSRNKILFEGVSTILAHPLTGDYGSYVYSGGIGSYPHNIISVWVNHGIVGFFLYLLLLLILWIEALLGILKNKMAQDDLKMFFIFLFVTTFALFFAKNNYYLFLGFTVGFYHKYIRSKRERNL